MVKVMPRISFGVSGIKRQTTAKTLKYPGHPLATLSISLLRFPLAVVLALRAE
jgi:hypothetical protein